MSGRVNGICERQGLGGRGRGRGAAIGNNYYGATSNHKGLCSALGNHVFDCSQRSSAEQM